MQNKIYLVKAFTKNSAEGNPAGVVLEADNLSEKEMLGISRELGFSESAFVLKSSVADAKIRFFSPEKEVDFCAHALIATAHTLEKEKRPFIH